MASLVLGVAGAAVGFYLGGPLGASIGWSLGAMVGAEIERKPVYGPKLTDLKLQTSQYGQMIPIEFGTIRIAGNVIWQTDLVEHEQKSGGKGAPTSVNYTYSASFAIMLCEGPIGGVRRIWADSRLVYGEGVSAGNDFPFVLYTGTEDQLPDPTIEALEGAGNVPAHRGTAYVVFTDITLTDYGNRIPVLTFEVFSASGPIPTRISTFTPFNTLSVAGSFGGGPQDGMIDGGQLVISKYERNIDASALTLTFEVKRFDFDGNLLATDPVIDAPRIVHDGEDNGQSTWQCQNNWHIGWGRREAAGTTNVSAFYYDGGISAYPILGPSGLADSSYYAMNCVPFFFNDFIYGTGGNLTGHVARWDAPGGVPTSGMPSASYALPLATSGNSGGGSWQITVDEHGDVWCAHFKEETSTDIQLIRLDADLNEIRRWTMAQCPAEFQAGGIGFTVWGGYLLFSEVISSYPPHAYKIDPGGTFTFADPGMIAGVSGNIISLGNGWGLTRDGIVSLRALGSVTLGEIVSALSVRAGLTTDQIDVTELPDPVDGYAIANQTDARSAIEPLQIAWPFDAVEHDVVVKFVRRKVGQTVTAIPADDLGAYAWPGEAPADLVTDRAQEVDLPKVIDAVFLNKETDYQNGEQRSQRLITTSKMTATVQLPIVMDNKKAREVTDVLLYNAWTERENFSLTLPRKWQHLEPSDLINVRGRLMRIATKTEGADGVLRLKGVATNLQVYQQATPPAPGVGMPGSGGVPPTAPPVRQTSDLLLLDIPLVHDTDYPSGYYAAMAGSVQRSWRGASLQKSVDGGANYAEVASSTVPSTFGTASTPLGSYAGGNTFDEINAVTVVIGPAGGELVSDSATSVLNGANLALLGSEVLQYRTATLTAPSTYVLTGLLRGRRGTEWAMATHVVGERFVLLSTVQNVVGLNADLQRARHYKAVTFGNTLASAAVHPFTDTGVVLAPYAPVHPGQGVNGAGDITLTWTRRTRINGTWRDYVDVPLSEASERYQVTIWTDSTYRTPALVLTVSTPSLTLTAAELAEFGSPAPTQVYWSVAQIGALGPGYDTLGRAPVYATPPPATPPPATGVPPMGVQWHEDFVFSPATTGARQNFNALMAAYGSSWAYAYLYRSPTTLSNDLVAELGDAGEALRIINTFGGAGNYGPAGMLIPFGTRIDVGPTFHSAIPLVNIPLSHPDVN